MDFEFIEGEVPQAEVTQLTLVPFFPDGSCAVVRSAGGGFELPTGEVLADEDYVLDSASSDPPRDRRLPSPDVPRVRPARHTRLRLV